MPGPGGIGEDRPRYDIRVGQLAVHTGAVTAPGAPSSLTIDRATTISPTRKALRLSWTPPATTTAIHHYEIHRGPSGALIHLGATPNTVYYLAQLDKNQDTTTTTVTVTAVGADAPTAAVPRPPSPGEIAGPGARTQSAWAPRAAGPVPSCCASRGPNGATHNTVWPVEGSART